MTTLYEAAKALEQLYPLRYAEQWDAPGLIVGDVRKRVQRIVCVCDPTLAMVDRALAMGADLLVTHHPLFFRAVHEVAGFGVRGEIVRRLIENNCGLWVGHTNADAAWRGVAHAAADSFGLHNLRPLVPQSQLDSYGHEVGLGRIGELNSPVTLRDFAHTVFNALPSTHFGVQVAGNLDAQVRSVAVLPGSGDSLFDEVRAAGVDVYVTSDLRHHPATDAIEQARYEAQLRFDCGLESSQNMRPMLINTPHSAIESLWFNYAVGDIADSVAKISGERPEVTWIGEACDPWNYVIN